MDTESTYSGYSYYSGRSKGSHRHGERHKPRSKDSSSRSEKSVIVNPPAGETAACKPTTQLQDDNWGESTTAITATSEHSFSLEDIVCVSAGDDPAQTGAWRRYVWISAALILALLLFVTPLAILALPHFLWSVETLSCSPACEGLLISAAFKFLILVLAVWAVFMRPGRARLPRVCPLQSTLLLLLLLCVFSYTLFYSVHIYHKQEQYEDIVRYTVSLLDTLLFIHYLAIVVLELRQLQSSFSLSVTRSTDGETRHYRMGQLSIQRAAVAVLEYYYTDFPVHNPALFTTAQSGSAKQPPALKVYSVDVAPPGPMNNVTTSPSPALTGNTTQHRESSHKELYYEEVEQERRVRKRWARLVVAVEEAFTHICRQQDDEQHKCQSLGPREAAQAVFPSMAGALQKYLRVTRQQQWHSVESIQQHLAFCITHNMSPKAFLESYAKPGPSLQYSRDAWHSRQWTLVSEESVTRVLTHGSSFQLRSTDFSLLVTIRRIPYIQLQEEYVHPQSHRFVLLVQSETSI